MRVAGVAMRPAGVVWRSPLGTPVRNRVAAASDALERSGRELVARTSDQARDSGARELKRLGDQLSESGLPDEVIDRLLSSGAFDRIITVVINHPATEALVVNVVDEPALERLVSRVMESRLVDGITAQLVASDEMQLILDYVTHSPEFARRSPTRPRGWPKTWQWGSGRVPTTLTRQPSASRGACSGAAPSPSHSSDRGSPRYTSATRGW